MAQAAVFDRGDRDAQRAVGKWLFLAASLLVLSVVAVTTWRWVNDDRELAACCADSHAGVVGVGQTIYFSPAAQPAGDGGVTLDLRSVQPQVVENSAGAVVTVMVCTGVGRTQHPHTVSLEPDPRCRTFTRFHAGSIRLGAGAELYLAVTPGHVGTVRILGSTVAYRDGLRRGTQHVGLDLSVRVRLDSVASGLLE